MRHQAREPRAVAKGQPRQHVEPRLRPRAPLRTRASPPASSWDASYMAPEQGADTEAHRRLYAGVCCSSQPPRSPSSPRIRAAGHLKRRRGAAAGPRGSAKPVSRAASPGEGFSTADRRRRRSRCQALGPRPAMRRRSPPERSRARCRSTAATASARARCRPRSNAAAPAVPPRQPRRSDAVTPPRRDPRAAHGRRRRDAADRMCSGSTIPGPDAAPPPVAPGRGCRPAPLARAVRGQKSSSSPAARPHRRNAAPAGSSAGSTAEGRSMRSAAGYRHGLFPVPPGNALGPSARQPDEAYLRNYAGSL
jgi:hypothetical protein